MTLFRQNRPTEVLEHILSNCPNRIKLVLAIQVKLVEVINDPKVEFVKTLLNEIKFEVK